MRNTFNFIAHFCQETKLFLKQQLPVWIFMDNSGKLCTIVNFLKGCNKLFVIDFIPGAGENLENTMTAFRQ